MPKTLFVVQYHLDAPGGWRTTANLATEVSELLEIKLGYLPGTAAARVAARVFLQTELDKAPQPIANVSQYLSRHVVLAIADPKLLDRRATFLTAALFGW